MKAGVEPLKQPAVSTSTLYRSEKAEPRLQKILRLVESVKIDFANNMAAKSKSRKYSLKGWEEREGESLLQRVNPSKTFHVSVGLRVGCPRINLFWENSPKPSHQGFGLGHRGWVTAPAPASLVFSFSFDSNGSNRPYATTIFSRCDTKLASMWQFWVEELNRCSR